MSDFSSSPPPCYYLQRSYLSPDKVLVACTRRTLPSLPQKPFDTMPEGCHTGTRASGTHSAFTRPRPALFGTYSLLSTSADFRHSAHAAWPWTLLGVLSPVQSTSVPDLLWGLEKETGRASADCGWVSENHEHEPG